MKTALTCMVAVLMICVSGTPAMAQWDFTLEPGEGEETVSLSSGDTIETGLPAWPGSFTLVGKIRALSVSEDQPVLSVNFSNGTSFTVGQGPASSDGTPLNTTGADGLVDGSAGFIFDLAGVAGVPVKTWGLNEENIFRITIERSSVTVDGAAQQAIAITGYHDGNQVYSGVAVAEDFGTVASLSVDSPDPAASFALSWAQASFTSAWAPLEGPATLNELPSGGFTSSDSLGWDFVYNADLLPETIVANGDEGWAPRDEETEGHPEYSTIVSSMDAQTGGLWSRLDDNSDGSGSQPWANGWLFATNKYDEWTGRMTLVIRIRDLGTNSEKSVIDFTTSDGANYWTLGHVAASADGPAGWEFGQTNDGRNGNGTSSDVRTGGFGEFVTIRIVIVDDTPGDGVSQVWGWQDGELVYQSTRTDDISVGEFGEIAFRRTSGGSPQLMEIDWIAVKFGNAWLPGDGAASPSGLADGDGNDFDTPTDDPASLVDDYLGGTVDSIEDDLINGVIGLDNFGLIKTVADSSLTAGFNKIFETDRNGMPVNLSIFYLGFDAMRDIEAVPNSESDLTGLILLDRFGGLHNFEVQGPGELASGPGTAVTQPTVSTVGPGIAVSAPVNGPRFDYMTEILAYNSGRPEADQVGLPYFLFDAPQVDGLFTDTAIARDIELAVDWRQATNAFSGYFMMDAFGGVHYVNNAGLIDLVQNANTPTEFGTDNFGGNANFSTDGIDSFFSVMGFKPIYLEDYAGTDNSFKKRAPYFSGFPIARDLEVSVRFQQMTTPVINDSVSRSNLATSLGIDTSALYSPIEIPDERANPSFTTYTPEVAITNGYVIMDGYGGMHSMIEDEAGNPIPAPWEDPASGLAGADTDAPYFLPFDLAVDFELYPNGQGYALLTRTGQVFTVNALGTTREDHFVDAEFDEDVPFFGFDAARDLTLVSGDDGKIIGMYILDRFGTTYAIGDVPAIPGDSLFLPTGSLGEWEAHDIELSPYSSPKNSAGN